MKLQIPALDAVQWALAAVAVAAACFVAWWFITAPARDAVHQAQARSENIQGQAHVASAADAAKVIDQAHATINTIEQTTRENADAIRHAPGADQPLDPGLNRVALERLCHRPTYAHSSQCLQLARPAQPSR